VLSFVDLVSLGLVNNEGPAENKEFPELVPNKLAAVVFALAVFYFGTSLVFV
jgi:hypothetical protein